MLLLVIVAVIAALAQIVVSRRFAAGAADLRRRVKSVDAGAVDPASLPPRVRAFAERGVAGAPAIPRYVHFTQAAEMRLKPDGPWLSVNAEQTVATGAAAFVWNARAKMAPLTTARVVDAFVDGKGFLSARLFGSIPVANAAGPEAARAEAMRYLAELAWAPHAILANPSLAWQTVDPHTVSVAVDTVGGRAVVRLVFDEAGDIVVAEADDRPYGSGADASQQKWRGVFSDYRVIGGVRIPARAEVSWLLDDGVFSYFRGEITGYAVPRD